MQASFFFIRSASDKLFNSIFLYSFLKAKYTFQRLYFSIFSKTSLPEIMIETLAKLEKVNIIMYGTVGYKISFGNGTYHLLQNK